MNCECELSHVSITLFNLRKITIFESVKVIERTLTVSAFTAVLKMQKHSDFIAKGLPYMPYCMLTICQPDFLRSHNTMVSSRILVAFIHCCKYQLFLFLPAETSCRVLINYFLTSNTVIVNSQLRNTFAFCLYALPGLN